MRIKQISDLHTAHVVSKPVLIEFAPNPFLHPDVSIEVPDDLDLSALRGKGKQPNEEELPTEQPAEPGQQKIGGSKGIILDHVNE